MYLSAGLSLAVVGVGKGIDDGAAVAVAVAEVAVVVDGVFIQETIDERVRLGLKRKKIHRGINYLHAIPFHRF